MDRKQTTKVDKEIILKMLVDVTFIRLTIIFCQSESLDI